MNLDVRRFERDLSQLTRRLSEGEDRETRERLVLAKHRLVKLRKEDRVRINHSVLELLCAKTLITKGFEVEIEHPLADDLVCDVYGKSRGGTLVVETRRGSSLLRTHSIPWAIAPPESRARWQGMAAMRIGSRSEPLHRTSCLYLPFFRSLLDAEAPRTC